jgi:hypothetical protein
MTLPPIKMILPTFFVARTCCKNVLATHRYDLTHTKNDLATLENDFAIFLVARSYFWVARSF